MSRRGFTLVELMVTVAVGAICVVLAANVAGIVIRQRAKAKEVTDLNSRARLVMRQLRRDIRIAGYGSTGAVAVDPGRWPSLTTPTGGFPALPAVVGRNAAPGQSDAIQLIVPDPSTMLTLAVQVDAGPGAVFDGRSLGVGATLRCPGGVAYVVDHSGPTGAGRTQLFSIDPNSGAAQDSMQFGLAPGSEVMCARVSTYWVDAPAPPGTPMLRRSDWGPGRGLIADGPVFRLAPAADGSDLIAPGILNLQVAYRVSAEAYVMAGVGFGPATTGWAYEAPGDFGTSLDAAALADPAAPRWFEVRQVRFSLLARTMRKMDIDTGARSINLREDQAAVTLPLLRDLRADWLSASESLVNLRYFDMALPAGVPAEPQ